MAEKSIDIVGEKIERLDIRRNTSNQIISYTLPDDSEKLYGIHRISGQKTAFPLDDFDRVIYSKPSELVNPIPQFEINIVKKGVVNTGLFVKPIRFDRVSRNGIGGPVDAPIMLNQLDGISDSTNRPTSPVVTTTPTPTPTPAPAPTPTPAPRPTPTPRSVYTPNKIICNELYRQGYLSEELWDADERYGDMMMKKDPKLVIGYQMWARYVVKYMKNNPKNTKFAYKIFKPWTEYMAYKMGVVEKPTLMGKLTNWLGTKLSYMMFDLYGGKDLLNRYGG